MAPLHKPSTAPSGKSLRTELRIHLSSDKKHFATVTRINGFERAHGRLRNVSRSGFFFASTTQLEPLTQVTFTLQVADDTLITGRGLVSWLRKTPDDEGRPAGYAIKIMALDNTSSLAYLAFLESALADLRVGEIMATVPLTCTLNELICDALQKMRGRNVGAIMIVDSRDQILGIFTERDWLRLFDVSNILQHRIENHMIRIVSKVPCEATVLTACDIFKNNNFRHLPVENDRKVAGIVSLRDVAPYWEEVNSLRLRRLELELERKRATT